MKDEKRQKAKRVRVTMTLTVEVDRDDWATAYGIDFDTKTITQDVKNYISGTTLGASDAEIKVIKVK